MNTNGVNSIEKLNSEHFSNIGINNSEVEEALLFDSDDSACVSQIKPVDTSAFYTPNSAAGTSLYPTKLNSHPLLSKCDDIYRDEDGKLCRVYKNDDGSYQIEKVRGLGIFDSLFGKTEIEQYDANGNLVAKQKDGVTYYYDSEGNLTKKSERKKIGTDSATLYNKDGSVKAEIEISVNTQGTGFNTTTKEYNEDGSYTQTTTTTTSSFSTGTQVKTVKQEFDKNGNPISEPQEVESSYDVPKISNTDNTDTVDNTENTEEKGAEDEEAKLEEEVFSAFRSHDYPTIKKLIEKYGETKIFGIIKERINDNQNPILL